MQVVLSAPVSILINYSLSLTLTPQAAVFDLGDVLGVLLLVIIGVGLIAAELFFKKLKSEKDSFSVE